MSFISKLRSAIEQPGTKAGIFRFAAISLIVFFAYLIFPVTTSTDSRWTLYFSMSMIREGNQNIDEYAHLMEDGDFRVAYLNGHIYSYFPMGVPIASVPFVWVVDRLFPLKYSTTLAEYLSEHFPDSRIEKIEMVEASLISALAAVLFFALAAARLDKLRSFLLTLVFALATPMLSTASRALWQHGLSVLCLTAALVLFLRFSNNRTSFILAGFLLGFAYVVRPTNSVSVFLLTLYVLINHRKHALLYFAGMTLPLALLVLDSWSIYHAILPPYYLPQRVGTNADFFNALLANAVSPNRGLFTSTPIFLISLYGMYLSSNKMTLSKVEPYLASIIVLHWLVVSSFENWSGGWSLGPRFFTDMVPFFAYFLIPVFEEKQIWASKSWKFIFAAALTLSLLTHARYVTSDYPMLWNANPVAVTKAPERVWDFSDLQIFRGTCKNKIRGTAPACWFNGRK